MLECQNLDILPYSADAAFIQGNSEHGNVYGTVYRDFLQVEDPDDWCIFSVEVRNTYGIPFEVTFERRQAGTQRLFTVRPGCC